MIDPKFFSSFLLPGTLAFIVMGMGLSLTIKDFKNIFLHPKALFLGLSCQLFILPVIALLIAYFSGLQAELQVGIVLIAACPGGAVSNLITYLFQGNVALSVSLTTINSFVVIFSIPIIVDISLRLFIGDMDSDIHLPLWATIFQILLITVVPCLLGIYIRYVSPFIASILEQPLKWIMPLVLALAMLGAVFIDEGNQMDIAPIYYWEVTAFVFILNAVGMATGFYLSKYADLDLNNQITIAIEVGLQNTALAITIATTFLDNQLIAIPATIYALFTFFSAATFGFIVKPELMKKLIRRSGAK